MFCLIVYLQVRGLSLTVGTYVLPFPHLAHVTAMFYNGQVQAVFF